MLNAVFLVLGFVPLVWGASILVDGASALARRFNVPTIVIGLTIVAFGTSAPEFIVNLFASVNQNSDIALGNIVGSNIFNILGILGISAMIYPLAVKRSTTWIEIPLALLAGIVMFVLANDMLIDRSGASVLSRIDGIVLLLFFLIFMAYNAVLVAKGEFDAEISTKDYKPLLASLMVIGGLVLLVVGGRVIVQNAIAVATLFGISERIIALTIVSIGTSLPELATSAVAARKKNVDIAIGNIVGSNIFNVFFVLGISATIYPVALQKMSNFDIGVNIFSSLLLFLFISRGHKLAFRQGVIFLLFYLAYVIALIAM